MFLQIINEVNSTVQKFAFFEFSILSYEKDLLILAGSNDFLYYHNIEIHFEDIFTIIANSSWRVKTESKCIDILEGNDAIELNRKFMVETGYSIFRLYSEDEMSFYIIAKSISFLRKVVRYYSLAR